MKRWAEQAATVGGVGTMSQWDLPGSVDDCDGAGRVATDLDEAAGKGRKERKPAWRAAGCMGRTLELYRAARHLLCAPCATHACLSCPPPEHPSRQPAQRALGGSPSSFGGVCQISALAMQRHCALCRHALLLLRNREQACGDHGPGRQQHLGLVVHKRLGRVANQEGKLLGVGSHLRGRRRGCILVATDGQKASMCFLARMQPGRPTLASGYACSSLGSAPIAWAWVTAATAAAAAAGILHPTRRLPRQQARRRNQRQQEPRGMAHTG